jgi:hypothetical protein
MPGRLAAMRQRRRPRDPQGDMVMSQHLPTTNDEDDDR